MKLFIAAAAVTFALVSVSTQFPDAPTGFDNKTNGMVDDATHQADQMKFDEVEQLSDGLGPLYNAQSCRECHQSPVSGASSQVTELRVGHPGPDGHFRTPDIPIAHGSEVVTGRSLVNDRAICPSDLPFRRVEAQRMTKARFNEPWCAAAPAVSRTTEIGRGRPQAESRRTTAVAAYP